MVRRVLSLVLALVAGLSAVLAVAGSVTDRAVRGPELTRTAVDRVLDDPAVGEESPRFVLDLVEAALPREVSLVAGDLLQDVTERGTDAALRDERVRTGVRESAEQARADWAARLDAGEDLSDASDAGTLTVPLGPVVSSVGVGLVDDLADGTADLLGNEDGSLVVPGGRVFGVDLPETDLSGLFERARDGVREFSAQERLAVLVHVAGDDGSGAPLSSLTDVSTLLRASAHWGWAVAAAAVSGLAALVLAPGRWRGAALAVIGLLMVGGGLAIPEVVASPDLVRLAVPEQAPHSLADLTQAVDGVVRTVVADSFAPSATGLLYGGGAAAVVGLLWAVFAGRRGRPAH
ncbi:hypothetical protein ACL90Y_06370 [Micrococcus luteus]